MGSQGQYFSEKQLRRIRQLLSSTDMTIKEIAERMSCSRTTVSSISAGALEGSVLVYRTDCRSSWRTVGAAMEGHRLGCENNHIREGFLERSAARLHENWPGARQTYASKSRAHPGEAS